MVHVELCTSASRRKCCSPTVVHWKTTIHLLHYRQTHPTTQQSRMNVPIKSDPFCFQITFNKIWLRKKERKMEIHIKKKKINWRLSNLTRVQFLILSRQNKKKKTSFSLFGVSIEQEVKRSDFTYNKKQTNTHTHAIHTLTFDYYCFFFVLVLVQIYFVTVVSSPSFDFSF